MAKPLDDDLRKRIVEAMQEADCCRAVGRQFRVAASLDGVEADEAGRADGVARPGQDGRSVNKHPIMTPRT